MPIDINRLEGFMARYFGPMGGFLLQKELKVLEIRDLNGVDETVRRRLVDQLVRDCLLTVMSQTKAKVARMELESILEVSEPAITGAVRPHI